MNRLHTFLLIAITALVVAAAPAQQIDSTLFDNFRWRMIGPHRGGRTVGVAGIPDQPNVFFIGVNNGGVWRTSDYGRTWKPIFDDQPTGSIGALAVAPSNPDIMYVGSGEGLQRPDLSVGDGVFKSTDGGRSWRHMGLSDAQQIGAVIVHPKDPDRVLVAVLGHPYGANEQRGVFRSTDGGKSWDKVLYKDENTGAIALEFDPTNPDIVFADLWSARLGPWENGSWQGKTSGLFKSTDGGTTWRQLTGGLPTAEQGFGRIGIAIAPGDPKRMYATVDAGKLGGIYRSDDAGDHWRRVNDQPRLWGRGGDFAELKVDPRNNDIVYVANVAAYKSTDGGATFTSFKGAPGGDDYHSIWINPKNPDIMLLAADQGAVITVNGGQSWSSWYNQPTAQFYHVITDNQFPYNVYGGQQESGSVGIVSRGNDGQITFREWHPVGVDEWGYIAPDPLNPNIIYGGKVTRFDRSTGQMQNVAPEAIRSGKYRFLRTMPVLFSPADPRALYLGSNVLFRTTTGGQAWDIISPDLSRDVPEVPENIGVFRTPEMATQPRRGVIYSVAPSPLDANLIWAGTDDGYVHLTRDGGATWTNVTPPALTPWSKIAGIDASHFDPKTAYIAVNRIRLDDMLPHVYRTHDGGASWQEIVQGLPASGPVNVVREDPKRKGLLFVGTERAVYTSLDDGNRWHSIRRNMPATSIRDLVIHQSDIVVGTHGRSFWILDNMSQLRQLADAKLNGPALFRPDEAYRVRWNMNNDTPLPPDEPAGENPPDGAIFDYFLTRDAKEVSIEITDQSNNLVRLFSSSDIVPKVDEEKLRMPTYWIRPPSILGQSRGVHRFVWDLHYAPPGGLSPWFPIAAVYRNTASQPVGPWIQPGSYTVTLNVDGKKLVQQLVVKMDPRVTSPADALTQQFVLSMTCYRGLNELRTIMEEMRGLQSQTESLVGKIPDTRLKDSLSAFGKKLAALEGESPDELDVMYASVTDTQPESETVGELQQKFLYLMILIQNADVRPTASQAASVRGAAAGLSVVKGLWEKFQTVELARLNDELVQHGMERFRKN